MSRRPSAAGAAILTGPGEEGKRFPSPGAALSAAITRASHAVEPCTYYVRDPDGVGLFAVEHPEDGIYSVLVHRTNRKES